MVNNSLGEWCLLLRSSVRLWHNRVTPDAGFPDFHKTGHLSRHSRHKAVKDTVLQQTHTAHCPCRSFPNTCFLIPLWSFKARKPKPWQKRQMQDHSEGTALVGVACWPLGTTHWLTQVWKARASTGGVASRDRSYLGPLTSMIFPFKFMSELNSNLFTS